jgi:lipopolysaccharide/colanic/teichoic acid biosynthesis glycosyltransferase
MYKFRTMRVDAEAGTGAVWAQKKDPRVTPIGAFLRKTRLDELPQLVNVLKGDMSLVGPRPLVLEEAHHVDEWARVRANLRPGITGLWQVLGRSDIPFEEMVKLDYLYVHTWSLWGDIKLLVRTIPIVFRRRGY